MEILRIEDVNGDDAEVTVTYYIDGKYVFIDFDPDTAIHPETMMQYSPNQARKLAAALILAAEEAEKR